MCFAIAANVLALGAVADFGAQNCQYTTKVDAWLECSINHVTRH